MDSYLAWVNGKSGRQSSRYADAFQCSIISEAIYHFYHFGGPSISNGFRDINVECNAMIGMTLNDR